LANVCSYFDRIGILMSDQGRFVSCIDCHLSLRFPDRTDYATIAKQLQSKACTGPILSRVALSAGTVKECTPTSEASNRFDFDHNTTPMWVFDNSTLACSAVNDAAVHDYGYSRKAFLSMTIMDFRPSEGMLPLLSEMSHRGRHDSAKVLGKHKKKDGRVIDVEVTRCEVLFNGCVADIVTAVDVTGHFSVPLGAFSPYSK
jgi:hypothetical protein